MNDDALEPSMDEAAWDAATARLEAAQEALAEGRADDALAEAEAVAEALVAIVGMDHPDRGNALMVMGDALHALGEPARALEHFRAAQALFARYDDDEEARAIVAPFRIASHERVGHQLALRGEYAAAEVEQRAALGLAEATYGPESPEVAQVLNTLGVGLRFGGRYAEAEAAYLRAGALRDALGLEQPADHHHNLSGLATARGDFAAAEAHARRAVEARRADGASFFLATDLSGLGDALSGLGRAAEAEAAYREALALFAACGGAKAEHPEVAFALHNMADTLADLGRPDEALATYGEALRLKQRRLGERHHEVAPTLNNMAALLAELGCTAEAHAAAREALAIVQAALPAEHPVRVGCETLARRIGAS